VRTQTIDEILKVVEDKVLEDAELVILQADNLLEFLISLLAEKIDFSQMQARKEEDSNKKFMQETVNVIQSARNKVQI